MFTGVLGHDLRSPLSAIVMCAKLLEHHTDESMQKIGARLTRSATWMGRMIEDVLDLTRARLGDGIPIHCQKVDLAALVQAVIQERQAIHLESHIELIRSGTLNGVWDEDRLVQVASNLIGNALQHGLPKTTVEVRLDGTQPQTVRLSVANEGHIAEELLPHIFDPFRSGGRKSTRTQGLGLGLYIVQQIVQSHGGHIEVTSPDGQKTCFTVTLPRESHDNQAPLPA
jgi:signal transduction histidine kinase